MFEFNHMKVRDRAMNFDFTHELLLGSALDKCLLADDLGSHDGCTLGWIESLKFIALREATLAQELPLEVPSHLHLSIILSDLFFDDGVDGRLIVLLL
jgi:hypothetical protein